MGIAQLISQRAERLHDRLAASKDLLEDLFCMIIGREFQNFGELTVQNRKIVCVQPSLAGLVENPFADVFKQCSRQRDRTFGLGRATLKCCRPASMNLGRFEGG
jgi:hypothetical protein